MGFRVKGFACEMRARIEPLEDRFVNLQVSDLFVARFEVGYWFEVCAAGIGFPYNCVYVIVETWLRMSR